MYIPPRTKLGLLRTDSLRDRSSFSRTYLPYAGEGGSMAAYAFNDDVKMTIFPPLNHHFLSDESVRFVGGGS